MAVEAYIRPLKKPRLGVPDVFPQDPKQEEVRFFDLEMINNKYVIDIWRM